jgi:hypothetical protein
MSASTLTEIVSSAQEQLFASLKQGQDAIVDGLKTVSGTFEGLVPFADQLPDPGEAVSTAFAFAQEALANQRQFVESVLSAVRPPRADA